MRCGAPVPTLWQVRYLRLAEHIACWSKDPSTQVGAVAVGADRRQVAVGYNGFPPGIADTEYRLEDRETKYRLIQHAERNVLDNATFSLVGGTLAVTLFPCHECAKSIISKRIARVICPPLPDREPWRTSGQWTVEMLREARVELIIVP